MAPAVLAQVTGFTTPHLDYHALAPVLVLTGTLVVVLLVAAVFFFVWNPWAEFDATTTWLILGGLAATFIAQEILVRRSTHWKRTSEHPELSAQVDLEGIAPDSPAGIEREYESHGGERS